MGMRYCGLLTGLKLDIPKPKPYKGPTHTTSKTFLLSTAKNITLAEYNPMSRDAITAHRLSDYRRRQYSLMLLPDVHTIMEDMLKTPEELHVSL